MNNKNLNCLLLWLVYFLLNSPLLTAEDTEIQTFDYTPRYSVGIGEVLGYNLIQSGFNRFVLDTTYSYISIDSVLDNLTSSWVWDSDTFLVNHVGHPYQGSVYYTAARSSHLNFYESAAATILGSITWEYFMENERQSINDLIVTTTGGTALGEMLFRFSDLVWHSRDSLLNRFVSGFISPMTGINKNLFDEKTPSEKPQPVHGEIITSASLMFAYAESESSVIESSSDIPGIDNFNLSINFAIDLKYGNPFSGNLKKPFDYFSFDLRSGFLNKGLLLEFFSEGLIKGTSLYFENARSTESLIGLFLGLDFLYGADTINLGSNSIGLGYLQRTNFRNDITLSMDLYLNFVFIGSSDYLILKYYDSLSSPVVERRNYSLGMGENIKFSMSLEKREYGSLSFDYMIYGLHILQDTVEDEGSDGYDLTGLLRIKIDKNISEDWRLGASFFMYHKYGFYYSSGNVTEFFTGLSFYAARIF